MVDPSRALLFENGAALGVFRAGDDSDGYARRDGPSVVVMEPSGASFTHVRQDGGCHRQLSEFCRRDLVPQVAAVARFRNAHSARPYISHRLHTQQESGSNRSSSRRKRAPSRLAQWPVAAAPAAAAAATATAARADGTVEVCAAGGNARLTLSASRMVAEVDYAIAVPSPGDPADTGSGGVLGREQAEAANPRSTTEHPCSGREWVTRQFLVGPGSSAVPPEFSHPVAVALRASSPSAAGAVGRISDGNGVGTHASNRAGGGGRKGFVTSELPRPENRPDHPSWDTVQASPSLDDDLHLAPPGYYGSLAQRASARASRTTVAPASAACLLSVDVMKLAEGRGFAGGPAAVVETTGGCTYRIVIGGGAGGGRGSSINVHVVVHADGTEVWLDGDFVRLVRPPSPIAAPPQRERPMQKAGERERLLHTSAASTIHFRVPSPVLRSPSPSDQRAGAAAAASPGRFTRMSLGDITSRALALRRQFVAFGAKAARKGSGSPQPTLERPAEVKIKPPTLVTPGEAAVAAAAAAAGWPPVDLSQTAVRRGMRPASAPRRLQALYAPAAPDRTPPPGGQRADISAAPGTASTGTPLVVESVDRGGSSFVAFSDGRARGAFADRTLVTLGAPFSYLPPPPLRRRSGGDRGGAAATFRAVRPSGDGPALEGEEEEEEDREIECIRPDGTVVRMTKRSLGPPRGRVDRGGLTTAPPAVGGDIVGSGLPGALRPYVVAVLRFAAWAATPPAARLAAAEEGAAGRMAAVAEAERNRRFVDLQRLMKPASTPPRALPRTQGAPHMNARASGAGGNGGSGYERRSSGGAGALACGLKRGAGRKNAGDSPRQGTAPVVFGGDGKENTLSGCSSLEDSKKQHVEGQEKGVPRGSVERNALVRRLLEANRAVLVQR